MKKKTIRRLEELCDQAEGTPGNPAAMSALVTAIPQIRKLLKIARKSRKAQRRLRPLAEACFDYEEFVGSDEFNTDRAEKYEHEIMEAAVATFLGVEFWEKVNEKTT